MAAEDRKSARKRKDQENAARMKALGICRTTARCSTCYRIITIDSWKSHYSHRCWL